MAWFFIFAAAALALAYLLFPKNVIYLSYHDKKKEIPNFILCLCKPEILIDFLFPLFLDR